MLKFTRDHEWLDINGNEAIVGITVYAQEKLGELVYVELPEVGQVFKKDDSVGTVESVKAASDVFCPVGGTIIAVNEKLINTPDLVNKSAEDKGWIFRIKIEDMGEINGLLDKDAYNAYLAGEQ